jgi:hypothetical protein
MDERYGQGFAMVTVAVFANIATAGGRETLGIELDRDGVRPVIANNFGGDFRATPDPCRKGIDVGVGFLAGDSGPLTFDSSVELFELCIGHTHVPHPDALVQGITVSYRCPGQSGV